MTIFDMIKSTPNSVNEKGNSVYLTTLDPNVDLFIANKSKEDISNVFLDALKDDRKMALKNLFYMLDIKDGKGQRKNASECLKALYYADKYLFIQVINFIPYLNRWDVLINTLNYIDTKDRFLVIEKINAQLIRDHLDYIANKDISLLAKWLPSVKTHNKKSEIAKIIYKGLNFTQKEYRQTLSYLRERIGIVERKLSLKQDIDFDKLTSNNLSKYRKCFATNKLYRDKWAKYLDENKNLKIDHFDFISLFDKYLAQSKSFSKEDIKLLDLSFKEKMSKFKDLNEKPLVVVDDSGSMNFEKKLSKALFYAYGVLEKTNQNKYLLFSNTVREANYNKEVPVTMNLNNVRFELENTDIKQLIKKIYEFNKNNLNKIKETIIFTDLSFDNTFRGTFLDFIKKYQRYLPKLIFVNLNDTSYFTHFKALDENVIVIPSTDSLLNDIFCNNKIQTMKQKMQQTLLKYDKYFM